MFTRYSRTYRLFAGLLFFLFRLLVAAPTVYAQATQTLTGKVMDDKGAGLPGATVVLKGTTNGSSTDENGTFFLHSVPPGTVLLTVSFVGYTTKEISVTPSQRGSTLSINLADDSHQVDEVIVTGVFDKRERMNASVAISTLSANQIALQTPVSAAELLKNVPGVYVNSSLGEIRNTVYSRGVSAGSIEAGTGYYYVSMQEDGLPVTNATYTNYGPDYFLRADATIGRLEAVRGGSAAITGPNAPGGIFNYVSKAGGQAFGGEVRTKFGLEGSTNPFYRADVNFGGKLNAKGDLTFNVGGFYRYATGFRDPGYAMNQGGQGKFNVLKTYEGGSLKLYGKYLDDHNGWFEFLPALDFNNPTLAPGVSQTDTYLPTKGLKFDYPVNTPAEMRSYDPSNLVHSLDRAIGLDWQHTLGKGWSFQNNVKYSNKSRDWNSGAVISPVALTGTAPYVGLTVGALYGQYVFTDHVTGQRLGSVQRSSTGNVLENNTSSLPGQNVQANSALYTALVAYQTRVQEVMDQGSVTKKFSDKLSVVAGTYVGVSHIAHQTGSAGFILGTIENHPHPIDVTVNGTDGNVYQVTNSLGVAGLGRNGFTTNDYRQTQLSGFAGLTWQPTKALTFDGGLRYDNVRVNGTNQPGTAGASATGGLDGNPLTVYDNVYGRAGTNIFALDKTLETLSFSGALNYRLSPAYALYVRYSDGRKAPDLDVYISANSAFTAANLTPVAQHVQQVEAGFKMEKERLRVFATPFYSLLSNVTSYATGLNLDNTNYNTPLLYNSIQTYGVELESEYSLTTHLSVRGVATVQHSVANNWQIWVLNGNGPQDDVTRDFSGNRADNVPNLMLNLAPSYTTDKYYATANYRYLGNRAANVANTFLLPGFSQFDATLGYNITAKFSLQGSVNNLFNGQGVMGFQAPGGYPASLDRQGFTPEKLAANPNATFSILTIQPRAYYVSAVYKF